jgi:monomeric sarcosine oxidase
VRVAVVGAGVMGCATAWALRERGADVTVHEQFGLDHDRGSSHGRTRIFRVAYPEPYWVRFAQEAYAGWRELDPSLLGLYGLIELVADPALTSARALDECGVPHRLLDGDEVRAYGANLPEGWAALHVPDAGVVFADRALHAFLETSGVEVETNRRIESTDELDADVVVVTAGSWVRQLVPDVPVTVTRETVAYFKREGPPPPSIADLNAETGGHGMYSLHDPVYGLKAGAHHAGAEADPDADGEPDPAIVERIAAWVRERFPDVDPDPVQAQACLYTTTADEQFVLERRGRVVVGSACSGHGFKFAPAVGRRLATLALGCEDGGS